MQGLFDQIADAVRVIQPHLTVQPRVGLILGTGLGGLVEQFAGVGKLAYAEIPHFPRSTVQSHAGQLVWGTLGNQPLIAMEGRFHYYEGYSHRELTFPVRVMRALGCDTLIVTNAAGGVNPQYQLADLMVIEDHICLHPDNPLRGINDDRLGPRFPDMSAPYDRQLLQLAREQALKLGLPTQQGVLVSVPGPQLETRAEYRMLKLMGADAVTMSTVPEVIAARHAGLSVLGFSVITDLCLPDALEPVELSKIIAVAGQGGARLSQLIPAILEQLPARTE